MTGVDHARAKEVFLRALDVDASEREALIASECGEDAELRARVDALLGVHARVSTPMELRAGTVLLDRYTVGETLGVGGMGEVRRAHDSRLERDVAIKVMYAALATSPAVRQRFEREVRSAAAFSHPNVMEIHDIWDQDGLRFAVMELVEGRELRELIREGMPVDQAVEIAAGVAAGLAAAHERGLMHRDIKPENVMVAPDGHVKVLDFGLARPQDPTADQVVTEGTATMGTVPYMSPEQAAGETLDGATDVFSLGTVLFEMLTGTNPFLGSSVVETLRRVADPSPPALRELRAEVPPEVESLVACMLEADRGKRPTADEVARDLRAVRPRLAGTETRGDGVPATGPHAAAPASPTEAPPETRYARCGNIHIAYQVFGDGPVDLLVVPGFISNVDNCWADPHHAHWLRTLGRHARVAIFDKRGTGLSDRVNDLPNMEERVEDVCTVMDAVGFESAALLGISEGGSLATVFAATHPRRCQALILHGSFARFESWFETEEELEQLFDYIRSAWGTGTSLPGFAPSMAGDEAFQAWWGKFERLGANPGSAIALMRMNSQIDVSEVLPSIQAPTLIIHRTEDVLIDPNASRFLAERIPGARIHSSPGSDHVPWVSDAVPGELEAVRDFLQTLPDLDTRQCALATVLAVHVAHGPDTGAAAAAIVRRIEEQVRQHRGSELTEHPRGLVATFDGPVRAIRCARAIVASTARARLCVHSGEIALTDTSVRGVAVDAATDVAAWAKDGEVVVTRIVKDLVAGSGQRFESLPPDRQAEAPGDWELFEVA